MTNITLVQGDITEQSVDAVVNAANTSLLGGGGVDGAIHRRGGPEILAECRALRASHYGRGLPPGQAVATTAGRLPARWVIHTVGPVHSEHEDRSDLLASCYRESLRVAGELGAATVAFPAISTGVYRWPLADAARIALRTVRTELETVRDGDSDPSAGTGNIPGITEVRFVLFDAQAYAAFDDALRELP
ncbi:O-acetyl-ADP-ribose deacetylase [Streptomyces varsoviensis]|uniref:O-acetyl-ADP-ribose deacetylase n=1 Tax=Streptomyces varsoviensis TaxID=67373 RepID=UPI0004CC47D6|nr:O-acetyl-ADP-ribose deacetylase [Streptomyces varsoviensis]